MAELVLKKLDVKDVDMLVNHREPGSRASAATRICQTVRAGGLSDEERNFALELMDYMARDALEIVRRALAVTLRNSPELPREIALKLIADIDNIAVPVIAHSPVLTDEDLIALLRSKAAAKIIAIAKRPILSGNLVNAIVRYGDSQAVAEVAANDGAIIDQETAGHILQLYHDNDLIKEAFISRRDFPVAVMEKLVTVASDEMVGSLGEKHNLSSALSTKLSKKTRERATVSIISEDMSDGDTQKLVLSVASEGRLTPSIILRAAGLGRMKFLTYALAHLAHISASKASLMIHDGGPFGLKALCNRAGFSELHTQIMHSASLIYRDLEMSGLEYDEVYFQSLMVQRMLSLPIDLPEEDQDWFLEHLDGLEGQAA